MTSSHGMFVPTVFWGVGSSLSSAVLWFVLVLLVLSSGEASGTPALSAEKKPTSHGPWSILQPRRASLAGHKFS